MKLDVEPNEAQFLLQVLGQLPTQSGAFPLLQKLAQQVQSQTPQPAPQEPVQ
jgi:hypothetical protein